MRYKVGDTVKVKSLEWYNENMDSSGDVCLVGCAFVKDMRQYCGKQAKVLECSYLGYILEGCSTWFFTDDMLEDLPSLAEKSATISEGLIKDIAEVIKRHNLGVSISENEGKLIIEPLQESNKEDDLPIDTPCVVSDNKVSFSICWYAGCKKCWISKRENESDIVVAHDFAYIIPFDKFNPNDIEESLKYNIVK